MVFVDKWPSRMQGQSFFGSRAGKVAICNWNSKGKIINNK